MNEAQEKVRDELSDYKIKDYNAKICAATERLIWL